MIDKALDWFIPHICSYCGDVGDLLCSSCEENIIEEGFSQCVNCLVPCYRGNLCRLCRNKVPYRQAYVVAWRQAAIKQLIDSYKFERAQAGAETLAILLDRLLPVLPDDTTLTYIPTIRPHVRQRGFDHMRLIVGVLARRRGLQWSELLDRRSQAVQQGTDRQKRLEQAKSTFGVANAECEGPILLVDDIFTTGATINQATKLLSRKHKQPVSVAIIARQPLDDSGDLW